VSSSDQPPIDPPRPPPIPVVPPPIPVVLPPIPAPALHGFASPQQLRPRDPSDIRWYKPSFFDALWSMGWKLIFFLPALILTAVVVAMPWHLWAIQFLAIWWKLVLVAVVLPSMYAVKSATETLKQRKEPFCIHCGYNLSGLPDDHTCPECGEYYNFGVIEEYKRDPGWFIRRYHMTHPTAIGGIAAHISKQDE
jgi:hypothetical protein